MTTSKEMSAAALLQDRREHVEGPIKQCVEPSLNLQAEHPKGRDWRRLEYLEPAKEVGRWIVNPSKRSR
jgi:hypothetical protein